MVLSKNKIILTSEESKKVIDLFSEHYSEESLKESAKQIGIKKIIQEVYFDDIYNTFSMDDLRHITKIKFAKGSGSRLKLSQINKIFKTINTINCWSHFPEDMIKYEYSYRIIIPFLLAIMNFVSCFVSYFEKVHLGRQVPPILFDAEAILVLFFLVKTIQVYWVYRKKLDKLPTY